jgi:hypothetical protein
MKTELRNAALAWLNHDETALVTPLAYRELARAVESSGRILSGIAENETASLLTGASPNLDVRFLIPNFCIAEVFAVFEKYRSDRAWNKQVKKSHVLSQREFDDARATSRGLFITAPRFCRSRWIVITYSA